MPIQDFPEPKSPPVSPLAPEPAGTGSVSLTEFLGAHLFSGQGTLPGKESTVRDCLPTKVKHKKGVRMEMSTF